MWNDQSAIGGGFFNSHNQFGNANTPNQPQKFEGRRASRTAPIVIKQALHSGDDGIKIWGKEIQIISLVARVRNMKSQSIKIVYTIQDITGQMKAVMWIDQDAMDEDETALPQVKVNDFVQIYGNIKTNKGRKVLMIFKITPITDVNAITFHYIHCIKNKVKMEADSKKKISTVPESSVGFVNESSSVNGLNPRQMMVYNLIRATTVEQGISKHDMFATVKNRMDEKEFNDILEWMCGEGHIYSTIDEEHFRATADAY